MGTAANCVAEQAGQSAIIARMTPSPQRFFPLYGSFCVVEGLSQGRKESAQGQFGSES